MDSSLLGNDYGSIRSGTAARPSQHEIDEMWKESIKESRTGLSNVPFCAKFGAVLGSVCVGLLVIISAIVTFTADEGYPGWALAVTIILALFAPCLIAKLLSTMCRVDRGPPGPFKKPIASPVAVAGTTRAANETLPYRSCRTVELQSSVDPTVTTMSQLWRRNVGRFQNNPVFGTRPVVAAYTCQGEVNGKTKTLNRQVLAPQYQWETFVQADEEIASLTGGLMTVLDQDTAGVEPAAGPGGAAAAAAAGAGGYDDPAVADAARLVCDREGQVTRHVGIYANTSAQYQKLLQSCFRSSAPLCTVYATLGVDGVAWAQHLCDIRVLVTEVAMLKVVAKVAAGVEIQDGATAIQCDASALRTVVVMDARADLAAARPHLAALAGRSPAQGGPVRVITYDELVQVGRASAAGHPADFNAVAMDAAGVREAATADRALLAGSGQGRRDGQEPAPEDTAVIMFTSGTTGLPKGVVMQHRNLLAGTAGIADALPAMDPSDTYIGYLPLAHVFELAAESVFMAVGCKIGYSHPFRLTGSSPLIAQPFDASPQAPAEPLEGDASTLKPTIICGVPAVYAKFQKLISGKFAKAGGLRAKLFAAAVEARKDAMNRGGTAPFWEGLLLDKVRTLVLGGRIRMMVSGGGPLSAETQEWIQAVFRCPMFQGYGLTETCSGGTAAWCSDRTFGRIGPPISSNDIKLVSWEEGGYDAHADPPRGEICISGDNITAGYYKMPEKTAQDFVVEGGRRWFHTGDIGQFDRDGVLRIIDRKKDLVKLSKGEYVALGKVESKAALAAGIFNLCVYADSLQEYCVAVATANQAGLPEEFQDMPEESLVGNKQAAAAIQKQVADICKAAGMARFEIPTKVAVVGTEEWLPPTGLVTASLKMQRRKIYDRFRGELDAMYGIVRDGAAASAQ